MAVRRAWYLVCMYITAGLVAGMMAAPASALDQKDLLRPSEAFKASLTQVDAQHVTLHLQVAAGYYLYRERLQFTAEPQQPITPDFPAGKIKNDPNFGKVEIYPHSIDVPLNSSQPWPQPAQVTVKLQGCAEAGVCYPPQTLKLTATPIAAAAAPVADTAAPQADSGSTGDATSRALSSGNLWLTLGLFFAAGVGLALTACMYPLLPIVSGIVIGQAKSRWRAFGLTFVYTQGLAVTYTVVGVAAASTGTLLTVQLQSPITTAVLAGFFIVMALSMFGLFDLQMPGGFQSKINDIANRLPGGQLAPVFVMGMLSALLVGACMAPPLFGALAFMAKTGDRVLGGSALYALGLGTGLPLLFIGAFGGSVLPRLSGNTMRNVKRVFGVIMLGSAVWISQPLWPRSASHAAEFQTVKTVAQLQQAVAAAGGKPVLLDFYADWCVSCVEFEKQVLPDADVKQQMQKFVLLRADVTNNSPEDAALLKEFGLYGPPAILFYDRKGQLQTQRVIGLAKPAEFAAHLQSVAGN